MAESTLTKEISAFLIGPVTHCSWVRNIPYFCLDDVWNKEQRSTV
jgi:hypothetical protein